MESFVFTFRDIDRTSTALAGGKGAALGELSKMNGILVPDGFCISAAAFTRVIGRSKKITELIASLSNLKIEDQDKIAQLGAEIRGLIENLAIPRDIADEIAGQLSRLRPEVACAVRSSATAEDLPVASFAGQQDSYLNIAGSDEILRHVSKCWASLFTSRAIIYRMQNDFDQHNVRMAVVVQQMVFPKAAGILFTADPVTSNRQVLSIDASFGLGEAMVAGLVNADNYRVQGGRIIQKMISAKKVAVTTLEGGGTSEQPVDPDRQNLPALTDEQVMELEHIGRNIEQYFGSPQDIEWCLADDPGRTGRETFYIVQSRPITTLFPIPEADDHETHVYVSVGHQQMMTDAMTPLGLSFYLLTTRAPMRTAGGRLFVDITGMLASEGTRQKLMDTLGKSEPLIKDALLEVMQREDIFKPLVVESGDAPSGESGESDNGESEKPELWEATFAEHREMWGFEPSRSAVVTNDFFLSRSIKNILIPGIGYGRNAQIFRNNGINVTGIEISKTAIEMAREHYGEELKIYHGSVSDMPFDDSRYDGIFCYALIHLLDSAQRKKLISDCYNQLSHNGYMIFTMISKKAATYGKGKLLGKDRYEIFDGVSMYFYDRESIREEFGNAGLVEISEIEESFPFYLVTCRKSGDEPVVSSPENNDPQAAPAPAIDDIDPAIVAELVRQNQESVAALQQEISSKSGAELFDFILSDLQAFQKLLFDPQNHRVIMAGMDAAAWINEKMDEWLGEKNAVDTLSQSAPKNITSEMGLALMDIADLVRPWPDITSYLQRVNEETFPNDLLKFKGGREVFDAIAAYLNRYGMRCPGEIDISRTRWSENPAMLVPLILNNIRNFETGAAKRKFERGESEFRKKEQELLSRLLQLPGGQQKAAATKRMIGLVRSLSGYREYPKYGMISRYFIYKQALLKEAERLVHAGHTRQKEDIFYLTFEELHQAVRSQEFNPGLVSRRKEEFTSYKKLSPPRVLTSDGEIISGRYQRGDLPTGALAGLAVSTGVVEGRARVILDMSNAHLEEGDILVTTFTDPSWTPLFVSAKALVTEVGGLMTHGAVIAREYGLPAVVGVENATKFIRDGQRIRVNGTAGYVEVLM